MADPVMQQRIINTGFEVSVINRKISQLQKLLSILQCIDKCFTTAKWGPLMCDPWIQCRAKPRNTLYCLAVICQHNGASSLKVRCIQGSVRPRNILAWISLAQVCQVSSTHCHHLGLTWSGCMGSHFHAINPFCNAQKHLKTMKNKPPFFKKVICLGRERNERTLKKSNNYLYFVFNYLRYSSYP